MIQAAELGVDSDWRTNGELIADVAALGYFKPDNLVLDPTYGKGNWWTEFRPRFLCKHIRDEDGIDFRNLPHRANVFDVVAFDPPYVCKGGRSTSGILAMDRAYGQEDAPETPGLLQDLIEQGMNECHRVLTPGGILLCKVANYISSGKYWPGVFYTWRHADESLGMELLDVFIHTAGKRPQPSGRKQVHARNEYSVLLVLRKVAQ